MKLECYKIPFGGDVAKFKELSGSRSKGRGQNTVLNKFSNNPYPPQFFGSNNDMFNHQTKGYSERHYKHMKSNSEAVHKLHQDFEESKNDSSTQGRASKKGLKLENYSPEKQIPHICTNYDNTDQNMIIFSNDFNTVKYSQSPFLNKLTNLKQKLSKKDKVELKYGKGHKSRNSMFPKSYTENSKIQRRENDVYTKLSLKHGTFDRIPEEPIGKKFDENRHHNPYTNIEVEHDVISAYGNEQTSPHANVIFQGFEKNRVKIGSDKKRAPTDTTRSKTGIDASNDSGKTTPKIQKANESNVSKNNKIPLSENKRMIPSYSQAKQNRQPSDYYQIDNKANDARKKGEIISILSMEIGESEGLSHSYSYNEEKASKHKRNSKKDLKRLLGINNFENEKTQKQNMQYLKDQLNVDDLETQLKLVGHNLNIVNSRPVESRHCKHRKIEYREKLEEEKGHHKKAKSHRNNKHQYIRNNHDIISKHQRHKSSDSTENSILKRSNGFEILFQRHEKLEKIIKQYDDEEQLEDTSYEYGQLYSVKSMTEQEESSSISEIENNKIVKIRDPEHVDVIRVGDNLGDNTEKSFESVLNCLYMK